MEQVNNSQKEYFQAAYQTGSDTWSHIPYSGRALTMLPNLERDSLVLDIGAGRGLWMMKLLKNNFRVLGIDYVESIVNKVNQNIKSEGYESQGRCVLGEAIDIPFSDGGFDIVTDVGTFQHLKSQDWESYVSEAARVLKKDGYYLNISLSKRTNRFLGFMPKKSEQGDFTKFGVHYYFFDDHEIEEIFKDQFTLIDTQFEPYGSPTEPGDDVVLIFSLMQKK